MTDDATQSLLDEWEAGLQDDSVPWWYSMTLDEYHADPRYIAAQVRHRADAAVVVNGSADQMVADLVAAGWSLDDDVSYAAGKRIRYIHPPEPAPEDDYAQPPCPECGAPQVELWSGVKCSECKWWYCA